ncbi:MAG TPA: ComEC/Rec2 family competence protein [Bacteroidales bacterium]|nr:ComEC/Rec2 family competence protein [Bacteroidales bacterium]
MLHKEIPFLRICLPLCCGIVAGLYYSASVLLVYSFVAVIILLFLVSLRFNKKVENYLFGMPVFLSFFLLGLLLYSHEKNSLTVLPAEKSVFVCTLSDYPQEKPNSLMMTVKLHQRIVKDESFPVNGSMIIYLSKDATSSFTPGDRLVVRCSPAEITNHGNPYEFNYKFYMEGLGIKYTAFTKTGDIIEHDKTCRKNLKHKALIIRNRIIKMYGERGVTDEMLPLVSAITLGEKSRLEPEQKENFIRAGIMHIMAVSGLHAVILSLFVLNMLIFLKRRFNFMRITIAVLFLWLFAFVTGLTPSVLRATLMFTFVQAGTLMHRKVNGINSVLASAFVLILLRPSVIFDAGFLLSYSAVIFIIAFYRGFYLLVSPGNKITDWIWQSAVVTIVAQLGTLTLTVMLFNRFPVWFMLTNIIIVPLSSLAIILGCLVPLMYPVAPVSGFVGFLLDRITLLTETLTEKAAGLPFSGITGIGMKVAGCVLLFCLIWLSVNYVLDKRKHSLKVVLSFFLAWAVFSTISAIVTKRSRELIVYNMNSTETIGIRTGKKLYIYSDTLIMDPEINRHRSVEGLKVIHKKLSTGTLLLQAGGRKIMLCRDGGKKEVNEYKPDILILSGFKKYQRLELRKAPEKIIVQSGYQAFSFEDHQPQKIHYIRKSGAYRMRL